MQIPRGPFEYYEGGLVFEYHGCSFGYANAARAVVAVFEYFEDGLVLEYHKDGLWYYSTATRTELMVFETHRDSPCGIRIPQARSLRYLDTPSSLRSRMLLRGTQVRKAVLAHVEAAAFIRVATLLEAPFMFGAGKIIGGLKVLAGCWRGLGLN